MTIELETRCDVPWSTMTEVGPNRRHCGECRREVVDISALTRKDAERLIRTTDSCVSFVTGLDGQPIFRRPPSRTGLVVLASTMLAACAAEEPACELGPEPLAVEEPLLVATDPSSFGGPLDGPGAPTAPAPLTLSQVATPPTTDAAEPGDPNDVDGASPRPRRRTPPIVAPHPPPLTRTAGVPMRTHTASVPRTDRNH